MIPNLPLLRERLAHLRDNLAGWRESDGHLVPTEPDPEERALVRARLQGAIAELEHLLGGHDHQLQRPLVPASSASHERTRYGYEHTIHRSTAVNVERDPATGAVVAVWFRCLALPFTDHESDPDRCAEMRRMYADPGLATAQLLGVDVEMQR